MNQKKVFVSYSRADYVDENGQVLVGSPVETIVEALKATNVVDVWIDVHSNYTGQYFTNVLAKKILWADKVLFLSSQNSNSSEWVSKEILFAHDNKKEILPVRLDESNYNLDYALILTGIDYIEYYKNPAHKISDIIESVQAVSHELTESTADVDKSIKGSIQNGTSNQPKKGHLNLNLNYKGCAMTMTILLGIPFLIWYFMPAYNDKPQNGNVVAVNGVNGTGTNKPDSLGSSSFPPDTTTILPLKRELFSPATNGKTYIAQKNAPKKKGNHNDSVQVSLVEDNYIAQTNGETEEYNNYDSVQSGVVENNYIAQNHSYSGAVGGPKYGKSTVSANSTDVYNIRFRAGEQAIVSVQGDGDTDLEIYVYDDKGNLIVSDTDYTDDCVVSWTPRWTGNFRIKIVNRGGVYNRYILRTN